MKKNTMRKLKLFRLICGLTQRELSEKIGCTQPLISLFETGRAVPGPQLKKAISTALNRTEYELFDV